MTIALSFNLGQLLFEWYRSGLIPYWAIIPIGIMPLLTLQTAGMALYIRGRRSFWHRVHQQSQGLKQVIVALLVALGIILIVFGLFLFVGADITRASRVSVCQAFPDSPKCQGLLTDIFLLYLNALLFIVSGIVFIASALKS